MFFQFLELPHKIELHNLIGRVVECPLDESNRSRASVDPRLRIPATETEIEQLFAGWLEELACCRKFAPTARNYAVAQLATDVGLRINEARMLDLDEVQRNWAGPATSTALDSYPCPQGQGGPSARRCP